MVCAVIVESECEMLWRNVVRSVGQCGDWESMSLFERVCAEICVRIGEVICVVVCCCEKVDCCSVDGWSWDGVM